MKIYNIQKKKFVQVDPYKHNIFEIIEIYITLAELARELNLGSAQVVQNWKTKNSIPHNHVHDVIAILKKRDSRFELSPLELCPTLNGPFKWEEKK